MAQRKISIHAPAKGATKTRQQLIRLKSDFNPRSREGSDDGGFISMRIMCKFQSTLPRRERRKMYYAPYRSFEISIHAPAKGATFTQASLPVISSQFQSTLPRRERPTLVVLSPTPDLFQSTLPRRERPIGRFFQRPHVLFQSTLPRRERRGCVSIFIN